MFPQASRILGVDLSPHMLAIGKFLIEEVSTSTSASDSSSVSGSTQSTPSSSDGTDVTYAKQKQYGDFEWVDRIEEDSRVEFIYSDISHTDLPSGSSGAHCNPTHTLIISSSSLLNIVIDHTKSRGKASRQKCINE